MNIAEAFKHLKTPIIIIGLGKSGRSAEKLLIQAGFAKTEVLTFDEKTPGQIRSWNDIEKLATGTLVVSPGVPLSHQNIKHLVQTGWDLTSEINLAMSLITDEIIIGITGSVGKSTVTSLLGTAVKTDDPNAFVGGNLGVPFCDYAISLLDKKPKAQFIVLELSSYQLENCANLKLKYSAITYLSANHLERYSSLDEYYMTKCHIGKITENLCVINSASKNLLLFQKNIQGKVFLTEITQKKINLIGKHNLENYFVALELAKKCQLSAEAIQAMQKFSGLPHRLENAGTVNGVLYINDSKATAMDSVLVGYSAASENIKLDCKIYLLLGGQDKKLPWQQLAVINQQKNIQAVFFGESGHRAKDKSGLPGEVFAHMAEAFNYAQKNSKPGDTILLSPGGTSFDEFKNFEDRGNVFKNLVQQLTQK
jgi:UDP-N-acetylmuramoylalanine--D-glutamate ligase